MLLNKMRCVRHTSHKWSTMMSIQKQRACKCYPSTLHHQLNFNINLINVSINVLLLFFLLHIIIILSFFYLFVLPLFLLWIMFFLYFLIHFIIIITVGVIPFSETTAFAYLPLRACPRLNILSSCLVLSYVLFVLVKTYCC